MRTSHIVVVAAVLAASVTALGQGMRGRQLAAGVDLTRAQTVTGTVTAVHLNYGTEYPSITMNEMVIKMAPVWFLLDQGFQVKAGDQVTAVVVPSTAPNDAYFYAIEITNNTLQTTTIVLRDAAGIPLWSGRLGARTMALGRVSPRGGCLDARTVQTVTGVIESMSAGAGIQMPSLVVKTEIGALVTVKIGPERILLENDFELKVRDVLTVRYVQATCSNEKVALELTNAAGVTLVLRNVDGTPDWN